MANQQELPEMNAEYIDHLLSGSLPEKKANTPLSQPKNRSPKKLLLVLAVGLLIVALCLFLPNVLANQQAEMWQTRAEEAYSDLLLQNTHHYKYRHFSDDAGEKSEFFSERWKHGDNAFIIDPSDTGTTYKLIMNGKHYQRTVTAEAPDAEWVHIGDILYERINRPKTLADGGYVFFSVRGTLVGTEVTFLKTEPHQRRMTFRFDLSGTLLGITVETESAGILVRAEYTLLPTERNEIIATIQRQYIDAAQ